MGAYPGLKKSLFLAPTGALSVIVCFYKSASFSIFTQPNGLILSMIIGITLSSLGFLLSERTSGVAPVIFNLGKVCSKKGKLS